MRVFFTNLGCKLNQAELEHLARQFRTAGHQIARSLGEADLHVVNTCSVTHVAARDSRKVARRGRRLNSGLRTVLTGCYATASPKEAAHLAGVDLVVPNEEKTNLLEHVERGIPGAQAAEISPNLEFLPFLSIGFGNSRASVKIEDGCNMGCAFCIIPLTRGPQRSRPRTEVVDEVRELEKAGFREIVITGVQISSYRDGSTGLFELVRSLLKETDLPRLRLTSIAPWQFDRRLLELFASERLCRHFHFSIQSGATDTLGRMRRPYTAEEYGELVEKVRESVPGVAITTDLIVGFPGESEEDFKKSLSFCEQMQFARIHAFPYSVRPGTAAADSPDQVSYVDKRHRMQEALRLATETERRFWNRHQGAQAQVLWEKCQEDHWFGTTDNYIRVHTRSDRDLTQYLGPATLGSVTPEGMSCALSSTVN